ncbi:MULTISPECIES: hypothetical protein [unclassified Rhodococcus (in: high G+C Gram-positive bacteria)]|uniref:hypothetical protein n=1 Tax=unclassified Rhodococcus (in: high G+C Gram-positive bacteria) TaxID=192944 RepID=UPI0015C63279|nr:MULTISPECIES: hypothetical protein [unclassified Rhodococcus (in: high G+C Gram-positive bacteria)]
MARAFVTTGADSTLPVDVQKKLPVTVGPTAPTAPGEYAWVETDGNGNFIDLHTGEN